MVSIGQFAGEVNSGIIPVKQQVIETKKIEVPALSSPVTFVLIATPAKPTILCSMKQSIIHVVLVVRDYDEAIAFFCDKLHFTLLENTYQPEQDKRWVVVAPPGSSGTTLLLARASTPEQEAFIGNQAGGRVFMFLSTDDFWRDYQAMLQAGIDFVREPRKAPYGTVAVFQDLYGNLWDLVELAQDPP